MKILVADDHQLVREGLKPLLRELDRRLQVIEAWDEESLLAAAEAHADIDLALIDLNMPGMQGAQSIASLRDSYPSLPIVVVSAVIDPREVERILRIGTSGYIPKTAGPAVIVQAIRLVLAGGQYLPPLLLSDHPAGEPARDGRAEAEEPVRAAAGTAGLSQRQQEVIELLAEGMPNKLIARKLGLTVGTVKSHLVQIFAALGVHNRTAAVLAARNALPGKASHAPR